MGDRVYRYRLDNKRKTECPQCGRPRCFSPYVENATDATVDASRYGYCDHRNSCGYHEYPRGPRKPVSIHKTRTNLYLTQTFKNTKNVEFKLYEQSLHGEIRHTNLFTYFKNLFDNIGADSRLIEHVFSIYGVAKANHWPGSNIFWLFDFNDRLIDGKIMNFNEATGKRVKEPYPQITWFSNVMNRTITKETERYNTERKPWFGTHLLKRNRGCVYIVESEKTALSLAVLLAHAFGPRFYQTHLPLATMGIANISPERFAPFEKWLDDNSLPDVRTPVCFIPDRGGYRTWEKAKNRLPDNFADKIKLSSIMEGTMDGLPVDLDDGEDIHDFINQSILTVKNKYVIFDILKRL